MTAPGRGQADLGVAIAQLTGTVRAARRRLRLRGAVRAGAVGAHVGAWAGFALALLLAPRSLAVAAVAAGASLAGAVGLAALAGAARAPLDDRATALVLDRITGSQELVLNAVHAASAAGSPNREATLAAALDALPDARALPIRVPRHARWAVAPLALAALALALGPRLPSVPWPGSGAGTPPEDEAVAAVQEAIARASGDAPVLPPELRRELAGLSEALAAEPLDPEQARAELERLQAQLQAFREDAAERRDLLDELAEAAEAAESAAPEVAEALRQGDLAAAEAAAGELAASGSAEQKAAAGEALSRAGSALAKSSDPATRDAGASLAEAGEGLQSGASPEEIARDLARAREAGEQLAKDRQALQQAQELGARLEEARQRMGGEPGVDPGEGSGTGSEGSGTQPGGAGEPQAGGEGGTDGGDGPAGGPAPGTQGGVAAGAGHTWEDQGEFSGSTSLPGAASPAAEAHQQIDDFQRYYDELRLAGARTLLAGEEAELHEAGRVDTLESRLTTAEEVAKVGAVELPAGYRAAADDAVTQEGVPAAYRDAVKQYFDQER